ncbi:MAG: substrate-binding domain-containing protein [Armatimonadetes bacterium]|nr:substrate-binding domain-containing protein [Armatimonadota bacterium]
MLRTLIVAGAIVGILAAGCGPAPADKPTSETPGGAGSKLRIVFVPKSAGNPYFAEVSKGLEKAAKELGATVETQAPTTADATSQVTTIKDAVQRGCDLLVISANAPDTLNDVLDEARKKGVTVVTVDSDITGNETHRDASVLPVDQEKVGPALVESLASLTGSEGEFAILSAATDAPNQNKWIAGMKETLKNPKYSKLKLVDTVYGDDEMQKSTTEMEALLTKYPNLRAVVSPTSVGMGAAAQVLETSGRYPGGPKANGTGIVLTGLATPNQLKKAVEKGVVTKFHLWSPAEMGEIAAHLGSMLHSKKVTADVGKTFDVPGMGTKTFVDKGVVYVGPLTTFDKSNIANFDF